MVNMNNMTCKELVEMVKKGYNVKSVKDLWLVDITLVKEYETFGIGKINLKFGHGLEYTVGTFLESEYKKMDTLYKRYAKCLGTTHEMELREMVIDHRE